MQIGWLSGRAVFRDVVLPSRLSIPITAAHLLPRKVMVWGGKLWVFITLGVSGRNHHVCTQHDDHPACVCQWCANHHPTYKCAFMYYMYSSHGIYILLVNLLHCRYYICNHHCPGFWQPYTAPAGTWLAGTCCAREETALC